MTLLRVVLIVVLVGLAGCRASREKPVPEKNGVFPAPYVSIPFKEFKQLVDSSRRFEDSSFFFPARIDFRLARSALNIRLNVSAYFFSNSESGQSVRLFKCRACRVLDFSVTPKGAVVMSPAPDGPELILLRRGLIKLDIRCDVGSPAGGRVLIDPMDFTVGTITVPASEGFVFKGGTGPERRGRDLSWTIGSGETIGALIALGKNLEELSDARITRISTLLTPERDGVGFRTLVQGVGLDRNGVAVSLSLPSDCTGIKVAGEGRLAAAGPSKSPRRKCCNLLLPPSVGSPWEVELTGRIKIGENNTIAFYIPAPTVLTPDWRGAEIAVVDRGVAAVESFHRSRAGWLEIVDGRSLGSFARRMRLQGLPTQLFRYNDHFPCFNARLRFHNTCKGLDSPLVLSARAVSAFTFDMSARGMAVIESTDIHYRVKAAGGSMKVSPPKDARILDCRLDDVSLPVLQQTDESGLLVRFRGPAAEHIVSVRYQVPRSSPGNYGVIKSSLPGLDLAVVKTGWKLEIPSDFHVFDIKTGMRSPLPARQVFFARFGLQLLDWLKRFLGRLVKLPGLVRRGDFSFAGRLVRRLTTPGRKRGGEILELKNGFSADAASVSLYLVHRKVGSTVYLLALLLGLGLFAYTWASGTGIVVVDPRHGLVVTLSAFFIFDWAFPFAIDGAALSFFSLVAALGIFRVSVALDRAMRLARLRSMALAETGTIGDLEGQKHFFATREKKNIISFAELFTPESPSRPESHCTDVGVGDDTAGVGTEREAHQDTDDGICFIEDKTEETPEGGERE